MYCKNVIIIVLILIGAVYNAVAGNNFTRLLAKNVSVQIQHPDTEAFFIAVTNSTDKVIVFKSCNFDCDCLEISSYFKNNEKCGPLNINLKPNDVLVVNFKINSVFYSKSKVLPIYFYFNNIVPAVQIVKVKADIKCDVIPKPENMSCIIPEGFKGKIGSFQLNFKNNNIKIGSIKSNTDFINAAYNIQNHSIDVFINKTILNNTDSWLNVLLTRTSNSKSASDSQKIQNNLKLHIRDIKIIPDLYPVPPSMDFGIISTAGEITGKEIVFKSRTDTPWKIIGSQIKGKNSNAVKRKILPQTNKTVNVIWAILDGKIMPGLIDTEIIVNTDHPFTKQITIPVNGQVLSLNKSVPQNNGNLNMSINSKKVKK